MFLKDGQHKTSHFIVGELDADEILASGKAIVRKIAHTETLREPRAKRPLPMSSSNMLSNVGITIKLKEYKQASDADGLENFSQNLFGCSLPLKTSGLNESEMAKKSEKLESNNSEGVAFFKLLEIATQATSKRHWRQTA